MRTENTLISGSILCSVPTENTLIRHHILWHLIWVYTLLSANREHPDQTPYAVASDLGLFSAQCRQRTPWLDTIFCGIWSGSIPCSVPTENILIRHHILLHLIWVYIVLSADREHPDQTPYSVASDLDLYRAQCRQRTPWLDSIFCGIWSGSILCTVPTENTLIRHHILWHLSWVYIVLSADREHPD